MIKGFNNGFFYCSPGEKQDSQTIALKCGYVHFTLFGGNQSINCSKCVWLGENLSFCQIPVKCWRPSQPQNLLVERSEAPKLMTCAVQFFAESHVEYPSLGKDRRWDGWKHSILTFPLFQLRIIFHIQLLLWLSTCLLKASYFGRDKGMFQLGCEASTDRDRAEIWMRPSGPTIKKELAKVRQASVCKNFRLQHTCRLTHTYARTHNTHIWRINKWINKALKDWAHTNSMEGEERMSPISEDQKQKGCPENSKVLAEVRSVLASSPFHRSEVCLS